MTTIYRFKNEICATDYIEVIAEYIDFDTTKMAVTLEMVDWADRNIEGKVACFYEATNDKEYCTLLFSVSEDAMAFKLRFL